MKHFAHHVIIMMNNFKRSTVYPNCIILFFRYVFLGNLVYTFICFNMYFSFKVNIIQLTEEKIIKRILYIGSLNFILKRGH